MIQKLAAVAIVGLFLAGCAHDTPAAIVVTGNGKCHPAQALPDHKTVKLVPVKDTDVLAMHDLLDDERLEHGKDVRDYNKLWDECVGKGAPRVAK